MNNNDFTRGRILPKLLRFMVPVLLAMLLQAMYGAVDLLVVGRWGTTADVSAVSTGSQLIMTITFLVVSFSTGVTVTVAQKLGEKNMRSALDSIVTGVILFGGIGLIFSLLVVFAAGAASRLMNAPEEAFALTVGYVRICGGGFVIISAFNLLGSVFRGLGDSKTPLMAVGFACVFNIVGDCVFVAVFHWGAAGAAVATVAAQLLSVVISLAVIRKKQLIPASEGPRPRFSRPLARTILVIGAPMALQDFMVSASFLVMLSIVNALGLIASAGVGVAEKVCAFIMLVPSAFMQSMSSFVAQNMGAGLPRRAKKALRDGISVSVVFGVTMFAVTFFYGNYMASVFSAEAAVITAAWGYLKAYAIDCLLTCFLFCFIGYYTGIGKTVFVMVQGICGAFCVRIPVAFLMQRLSGGSLFLIGLATPCATVVQILLCFLVYGRKKQEERLPC